MVSTAEIERHAKHKLSECRKKAQARYFYAVEMHQSSWLKTTTNHLGEFVNECKPMIKKEVTEVSHLAEDLHFFRSRRGKVGPEVSSIGVLVMGGQQ